jgi:hypothetical protein
MRFLTSAAAILREFAIRTALKLDTFHVISRQKAVSAHGAFNLVIFAQAINAGPLISVHLESILAFSTKDIHTYFAIEY